VKSQGKKMKQEKSMDIWKQSRKSFERFRSETKYSDAKHSGINIIYARILVKAIILDKARRSGQF
jgi:hypothetical protein